MAIDRLFTVVIPTRERADTLFYSLKTVCRQQSRDLTILVSDNASLDNTEGVVNGFQDPRLRYIRPERRLSMAEHWEFALGHVRSEYVMFLGDDDGLMQNSVKRITNIIKSHRLPPALTAPEGFFFLEQR